MQLRLDQSTINGFRLAMSQFLPHYINFDLNLPTKYHYTIGLFIDELSLRIDWKEIEYENA